MATKRKIVFRQVKENDGSPIHVVVELFNTTRYKIGDTETKEKINTLIQDGVEVVIR